jgi:hypothetical protein
MHFIEEVVHHIQMEIFIGVFTHKATVKEIHELNKSRTNSILISSSRRKAFPEHAKKNIVEREQTHNGANLLIGRVERSQLILIRMSSMLMHTMTNWHTKTLESIVQQLSKFIEVGLTHVVSCHPLEGESLIFLKGKGSIELLNDLLIVVTLNIHEVK